MQRIARYFGLVVLLSTLLLLPSQAQTAAPPSVTPPQIRGYWVDAFGPGLFNQAEINKLVADVKAANMNVIVAQIGRRFDCFCNRASMPRTQAAIAPLPFDPLDALIQTAHANGIQVHAWIITTAMWNSATAPLDPNHAFNLHGISQTGPNNWLTIRSDGNNGSTNSNFVADPGHPAAADYIVKMYTSVAQNYDIDGLNFDRVRYPDFTLAVGTPSWGYNPVSVARFQATTGITTTPDPLDAQWMQWRRDQVTNIVRRVYLETYKIDPSIRISVDTITYGYGPTTQGGWESTRTYKEVLQDWRGWMQEGIVDLNIPMNYKREHLTTEPNNQQRMYQEWNDFAKDNQYNRQTVIGPALYLNTIANSVIQVRKALAPSTAGNSGVGWVGYSYRTPDDLTNAGTRSGDASRVELTRALTSTSEYDLITPPVFAEPTTVPTMPWKLQPTKGHITATVSLSDGMRIDQIAVTLSDSAGTVIKTRPTDGTGWVGFVDLAPGTYRLTAQQVSSGLSDTEMFSVTQGQVSGIELVLMPARVTYTIYLPLVRKE